jgi:hypothetical protein
MGCSLLSDHRYEPVSDPAPRRCPCLCFIAFKKRAWRIDAPSPLNRWMALDFGANPGPRHFGLGLSLRGWRVMGGVS